MPPVLLTLLGAGCMEWLGERQDTVNLRCSEPRCHCLGLLALSCPIAAACRASLCLS